MTGIQDALAIVRRALVNGAPPEIYEAAYPALHYVEAEIARLEQELTLQTGCADGFEANAKVYRQRAEAAEAEKERWKAIAGFRRERHKQAEAENTRLRDGLRQARECCARPPGVCFNPSLLAEDGAA